MISYQCDKNQFPRNYLQTGVLRNTFPGILQMFSGNFAKFSWKVFLKTPLEDWFCNDSEWHLRRICFCLFLIKFSKLLKNQFPYTSGVNFDVPYLQLQMTNLTFPYPPFPKTFSNSKSDGPSFSFGFTVSWHNGTFSTSSPNFSILEIQLYSRTNRSTQNKKKYFRKAFHGNASSDGTYSSCKMMLNTY